MKTIILTSVLTLAVCCSVRAQKPGETEYKKADTALKEKDFQAWFDESQKAAEKGHEGGLFFLGLAYDPEYSGQITVPKDKNAEKAFGYYKKSGDAGSYLGAYTTAMMYRDGNGIKQNRENAAEYFKKAYELGHSGALSSLYSVLSDTDKFTAYLKDCISRKNYDAARELAVIYIQGNIVTADVGEAVKWLEIGEKNNHAGCIYVLGYLYRNGFKKAADGKVVVNDKDADKSKAIEYYTKAGNLGNIESMNNLGEMYIQGLETAQDMKKAFYWFGKACDAEDGYSCYMCSFMISQEYVDKPMEESGKYLKKSMELGYDPTKKR